jgi:hypothetical protein
MLKAYYGEWNKDNSHSLTAHSLDVLHELIDRLAAARPVSSYRGGARGDHAWIIVSDHGFDLSVYFGENCREDGEVRFLLYGPYSPGERGDIYDGRGLDGSMTTACLKGLLTLLDQGRSPVDSVGRSPVDYVRELALEASVVTD